MKEETLQVTKGMVERAGLIYYRCVAEKAAMTDKQIKAAMVNFDYRKLSYKDFQIALMVRKVSRLPIRFRQFMVENTIMDLKVIKQELLEITSIKDKAIYLSKQGIDINFLRTRNLGRCYNAQEYEISAPEQLSNEFIIQLWEFGLLGYGQEFEIKDSWFYYKYIVHVEARVDSSD